MTLYDACRSLLGTGPLRHTREMWPDGSIPTCSACMLTSRIKQAISSVQLYVQRCLLNLEQPTVTPDAIDVKQWEWRKLYRVWEALTYGVRINRVRLRGSAVIYSTKFLKSVGGYPLVESPDTWLYNHAHNVVQAPMRAYHVEKFDLRHSIQTQFRSGKARAEMNQPMWRVAAHSLFRLRPLVLYAYLRYRRRKD